MNSKAQYQDTALEYLNKGKEKFNTGVNLSNIADMKEGQRLFTHGIETLLSVCKMETSETIIKILKQKITTSLDEMGEMKKFIETKEAEEKNKKELPPEKPSNSIKPNKPNNTQQQKAGLTQTAGPKINNPNQNPLTIGGNNSGENEKFQQMLTDAIVREKPNVHWTDIAGLENAKKALQEAVILPIKYPEIFNGVRQPWKGILLYGPPGTGKTYLAKACATEAEATFFSISASDLVSKYVGESEKLIRALFNLARDNKPSIIFIDEIDSMVSARSDNESESSRRIKTEFLVQMNGVGHDDKGVLVLGATNIPWGLDPAVRRRFEKRVYITLPELPARQYMLQNMLKNTPHSINQQDFEKLAERTDGFSGSDMSVLVRDAVYQPLRRAQETEYFKQDTDGKWIPCSGSDNGSVKMKMQDVEGSKLKLEDISAKDFYIALSKAKPSVGKEDMVKHDEFTKQFGMEGQIITQIDKLLKQQNGQDFNFDQIQMHLKIQQNKNQQN